MLQMYIVRLHDSNNHHVNIFLVGVHSVAYAFPKVKLVTTAVDPEVNEKFHILPGIGQFLWPILFGFSHILCKIFA